MPGVLKRHFARREEEGKSQMDKAGDQFQKLILPLEVRAEKDYGVAPSSCLSLTKMHGKSTDVQSSDVTNYSKKGREAEGKEEELLRNDKESTRDGKEKVKDDHLRGVAVGNEKEEKKKSRYQGLDTRDVMYYAPKIQAYFDDLIAQGIDDDPAYDDASHGMLAPVGGFPSKKVEVLAEGIDRLHKKRAFNLQFQKFKAYRKKEDEEEENKEEGEENLAAR